MPKSQRDPNAWLRLVGSGLDFGLQCENRFQRIIHQIPNPSACPSMGVFLGGRNKDAALCQIFHRNNLKRRRSAQDSIRLDIDKESLRSEHPILFADADPNLQAIVDDDQCEPPCHQHQDFPLKWAAAAPHLVQDTILSRLLFLFADVICLFADDVGGLDGAKTLLITWGTIGSASSLSSTVRPRLLVVLQEDYSSATYNLLERENFRYDLLHTSGIDLSQTFSSIKAVVLPGEHLSPHTRHIRLRQEISKEFSLSRETRKAALAAFSATHQSALFDSAILHTSHSIRDPFDFVRAARVGNELGIDYSSHVEHFLLLANAHGIPLDATSSFIASSVLMDAYPPKMHMFDPVILFRTMYLSPISYAAQRVYEDAITAEKICQSVQNALVSLYDELSRGPKPSSAVHRANLSHHRAHWTGLRTNLICLCCLSRTAEFARQCGHSLCEKCVRIFGEGMAGFEHQYAVRDCVVCQTQSALIVKLKPPTAGVRILSIDGGGTRGIVPLETLSLLQDLTGPDYMVQDFFDLTVGTSVGGLIALILVVKRQHVDQSVKIFKSLTRRFFGRSSKQHQSITDRLRQLVKCWLSDGLHDVEALENALKEYFGNDLRMFDSCPHVPSGPKVAVIATNISDASAFVFANYNGERMRSKDCGYRLVRPQNAEHEPLVWQAGRATSAAPVLFRPVHIFPLGTFQDGALSRHNNPIMLALWESDIIWPSIAKPDVVVSLGTGTDASTHSPKMTSSGHIFKDGFGPRLYRSFKSLLDGQITWRDLWNTLDDQSKHDYFRLTTTFPGPEPAIDDIECMDSLSNCVRTQPRGPRERLEVLSALLISSFFFELEKMPVFERGFYRCRGVVRCRSGSRSLIRTLARMQEGVMEFYNGQKNLGCKLEEVDICAECCRYRRPVEFLVRSLDDSITLLIKGGKCEGRNLSAMPNSVSWFINQQRLQSPFGSATHNDPGSFCCQTCSQDRNLHTKHSAQGRRKRPMPTLPSTPRKRALRE